MRTVTWAAALLLLAGCASDEPGEATPAVEEEPDVGYQDDLADSLADGAESSVPDGETEVSHDDGLTVRLAGLETLPSSWGADVPSGHALVKVTLELENTGGEAIPLESPMRHMALLHGPNREDADRATGYMTDDPEQELASDLPRQVGDGQTVEVFYTFEVPDDGLDELTVESSIEPDQYPSHLFVGAETLLTDA